MSHDDPSPQAAANLSAPPAKARTMAPADPEYSFVPRIAVAVDQFSAGLALLVVVLAPLPFGSVETPWIALWCGLMAVSLLTANMGNVAPIQHRIPALVLLGYVMVMGVVVLQVIGIGSHDPVHDEAARLLGGPVATKGSVTVLSAVVAVGPSLLAVLVFVRFALMPTVPPRAALVLQFIGVAGLVYAIATSFGLFVDPKALLWREKTAYLGSFTGTFVNRNTAATFFGTVTLVWWVKFLEAASSPLLKGIDRRGMVWLLLNGSEMRLLGLGAFTCICLAATAATGSRAGFLLTLLVLALAWRMQHRTAAMKSGTIWIGFIAVIAIVELFGDIVGDRIRSEGLISAGRSTVYESVIGLIAQRPWLGIGIGQFEHVFPSVRPAALEVLGIWDRAHSTPLELAVEIGLPAFAAIAAVWCGIVWTLGRAAVRTRDTVLIVAACASLLGTLHSVVDFSLQIPGYAVVYAALVGTGVSRLHADRKGSGTRRASNRGLRGLLSALRG